MPELWFGPDGSLELSVVADGDPDSMLPILPFEELAALQEVLGSPGPAGGGRPSPGWDPGQLGFAPADHEHGDALAAAMGGVHHDDPVGLDPALVVDDLLDPWAADEPPGPHDPLL
jgi:hypothetical protein